MVSLRPRPSGLRHRLGTLLSVGVLLALLAGAGFAAFESRVVTTYWQGVWWALSLMTTVGFIGEAPETDAGRILSAVLMVSGFALMAVVTASIASLFVHQEEEPELLADRELDTANHELLQELGRRLTAIEESLRSMEPGRPSEQGQWEQGGSGAPPGPRD